MKNLAGLLKLDTKLITPYWKWLVMFFGIALLMAIVMGQQMGQSGMVFIISFAMFSSTFTAFNFENTDKSNLNVLFATLPTNRKALLFTRYLYTMIVLAISLVVAIVVAVILDLAFANEMSFQVYLMFVCLAFGLFSINVAFPYPFFYKKGYVKAKIFLWIPLIFFMIVLNFSAILSVFNVEIGFDIFVTMFSNMTLTKIIAVSVGVVALVISYIVSRRIYLRKDF